MLHTPACDLLGLTYPICQAGMANYTSSALVAAVSLAGGLGCHGTFGRSVDEVQEQLRATAPLLQGAPYAANIVAGRTPDDVFALCLAEQVPVLAFSWGLPLPWIAQAKAQGIAILIQVTTVAEVPAALAAGADLLIAQGTEAGGHSGFVPLAELLPAVLAAARGVPVLASGGIASGRDLAAALALGAAGGWLGTRFLATPEAPISPAWKAAILAAATDATVHTTAFDTLWGLAWTGGRVRAIRNQFTERWHGRETALLANHDSVQAAVWQAERADDPSLFALMAGTGVDQINRLQPAGELVRELAHDAAAILAHQGSHTPEQPATIESERE